MTDFVVQGHISLSVQNTLNVQKQLCINSISPCASIEKSYTGELCFSAFSGVDFLFFLSSVLIIKNVFIFSILTV